MQWMAWLSWSSVVGRVLYVECGGVGQVLFGCLSGEDARVEGESGEAGV